jgi:outer membrane murein-binding lipoprotein Lpp
MGAAKKVVQLERKAKKAELTEVVRKPKKTATVTPFEDYAALAQGLTREKSMTHDEVEALLEAKAEPVQAEPVQAESGQSAPETPAFQAGEPAPQGTRRDMSKIALFASLVAVILLLGFYFNLNQNIRNLTTQVQDLASIKTSVATLDTKVGTMESKVADLETLPAKTRAALMSSILEEMSQKTSYMSSQLQSPEQQDKLMKAKELIQQVQTELNTTN